MDKRLEALVLAHIKKDIADNYDRLVDQAYAEFVAERASAPAEERHCQVVEPTPEPEVVEEPTPEPDPVPEQVVIEEQPPEPEPVSEPEDKLDDIDDEPVSVDTSDEDDIDAVVKAAQSDDLVDIFTIKSKSAMKRLITTAYFSNDDWEAIAMHLIRQVGMDPEKAVNLMVAKKDRFPNANITVDLAAPSFLGIVLDELMELEEGLEEGLEELEE